MKPAKRSLFSIAAVLPLVAALATIGIVIIAPSPAPAQDVLPMPRPVPEPPDRRDLDRPDRPVRPPEFPGRSRVESRAEAEGRLDGTILQLDCSQYFRNHGRGMEEVEVLLPIPPDAVVSNGLLLADGQEIPAEVLPAGKARRIYEDIVRSRRDPALLELAGHGLIRLSAFPIPPHGERTVSYRTQQSLAPAADGRTRLLIPVASLSGIGREHGEVSLSLVVNSPEPLLQVYSPSHDIDVDRESAHRARIEYRDSSPDPRETIEIIVVRDAGSMGIDLRTARGHDRGEDDYFLLALSPGWDLYESGRNAAQRIIFVLDVSGSMKGEKFEQARAALRDFIHGLDSKDSFDLVAFSNEIDVLYPEGPRKAGRSARAGAMDWIDDLRPDGGTAIAEALETAIDLAGDREDAMILFLTDGLPTVGEQNTGAILRIGREAGADVRVYAFGVGYDVDARLLDGLARQSHGTANYVRPGEDIAAAVEALHARVGHPCARNVRIEFDGAQVSEVYPSGPRDLYANEPLLVAGRVDRDAGPAFVRVTGRGPNGERLAERWRIDFADRDLRSRAVPTLWAARKAADLIERMRVDGRDEETVAELRELSERYGILNEEVSLLAREDDLLADSRMAPPPSPPGGWQPIRPLTRDRGGASHAAPDMSLSFEADGRDEVGAARPMQAPAPSAPKAMAREREVGLSDLTWKLEESKSAGELRATAEGAVRAAGGKTFHLEKDVWTDDGVPDPLPKGIERVRVKSYGSAYFRLAGENERLREMFGLGERVTVYLDGVLLVIDPEGTDGLPDATIDRILRNVKA